MRHHWYAVLVREPAGETVTFTEYAKDAESAIENFRTRGKKAKKASVLSVTLEPDQTL